MAPKRRNVKKKNNQRQAKSRTLSSKAKKGRCEYLTIFKEYNTGLTITKNNLSYDASTLATPKKYLKLHLIPLKFYQSWEAQNADGEVDYNALANSFFEFSEELRAFRYPGFKDLPVVDSERFKIEGLFILYKSLFKLVVIALSVDSFMISTIIW